MKPLPCPLCRASLEPTPRRHGLVWVCRICCAGAVTLPILRQVAPRPFVNTLWQAALHQGRTSRVMCPACQQPFTELKGVDAVVNAQLKVCVRCFWVWLRPEALPSLATPLDIASAVLCLATDTDTASFDTSATLLRDDGSTIP